MKMTLLIRCSIVLCHFLMVDKYSANAQNAATANFRSGFVLGANASQIDGDGFNGFTKPGLHVGAIVELPVSTKWHLSLGIEYDQKGAKSDPNYNLNFPDSVFLFKLNYVEIPLMVHYHYKPRVVLGIGATYGKLLSAKESFGGLTALTYSGGQWSTPGGGTLGIAPSINNYDLSGMGDVAYLLDDHWTANVRYSYSIIPYASSVRSRFARHGQFHNVITMSIIYMLGKPHKYG